MIYLALTFGVTVGAFLWLLIRAQKQIDHLLDRIQAPEMAVMERVGQPPNLSLAFDSDEEFWKAQEERKNT